MSEIKRNISVSSTESEIAFDNAFPFVWIRNLGENDCYAAGSSNFTITGEDVVLIKSGESTRVDAVTSSIFIKTESGTTTVDAHAQTDAMCPFGV